MAKFISARLLVASVGLLATILLPTFAWADGFYVDLHGGATIFNNDAARATALTPDGGVHAHTNYDTGWLAGSSAGYEWKQGFAGEFEFTFRRITWIGLRVQQDAVNAVLGWRFRRGCTVGCNTVGRPDSVSARTATSSA
jgi:hypothetical protein